MAKCRSWVSAASRIASAAGQTSMIGSAPASPSMRRNPKVDMTRLRAHDPTLRRLDWHGLDIGDEIVFELAKSIGPEPSATTEDIDQWFEEIDEDGSGRLDRDEVTLLLTKMGTAPNTTALNQALKEMDPDDSGEVSKGEFEDWYRERADGANTFCCHVNLSFNLRLTDACVEHLAAAIRRCGVTEVRLTRTRISEAGQATLRAAFTATAARRLDANDPDVTEIDWSDTGIGDAEVEVLISALSAKPNTACQRLDFSGNAGVTDHCVSDLTSAVRRSGVVEVRLAGTEVTQEKHLEAIRSAMIATALRRLSKDDPHLIELGWSDTGICDRDVFQIVAALKFGGPGNSPNTHCTFVDLRWNDGVSERVAAKLAEAVGRKWMGWVAPGSGPVEHPLITQLRSQGAYIGSRSD